MTPTQSAVSAWRWDQGRLSLLSLSNSWKIAEALHTLSGKPLHDGVDHLRAPLCATTQLSFGPAHYTVWRNYSRLFKLLGLASNINDRLMPTALCEKMTEKGRDALSYDDVLQYIARVFYYPAPVFDNYDTRTTQVFPFCAVLKLLIARAQNGQPPSIASDDVFRFLIGNKVTGAEPLAVYRAYARLLRLDERTQAANARTADFYQSVELLVLVGQAIAY